MMTYKEFRENMLAIAQDMFEDYLAECKENNWEIKCNSFEDFLDGERERNNILNDNNPRLETIEDYIRYEYDLSIEMNEMVNEMKTIKNEMTVVEIKEKVYSGEIQLPMVTDYLKRGWIPDESEFDPETIEEVCDDDVIKFLLNNPNDCNYQVDITKSGLAECIGHDIPRDDEHKWVSVDENGYPEYICFEITSDGFARAMHYGLEPCWCE